MVKADHAQMQVQRMYNLTVDKAHTFFVGGQRWLVHNVNPVCEISKLDEDWAQKGAHIKVRVDNGKPIEIAIRPDSTGEGINFSAVFSADPQSKVDKAIRLAQNVFENDSNFVGKFKDRVTEAIPYVLNYPNAGGVGRSLEFKFLKITLGRLLGD
ncbi:MAG: hypothetical protein ABI947_09475 [Chloroflexota bacterium]